MITSEKGVVGFLDNGAREFSHEVTEFWGESLQSGHPETDNDGWSENVQFLLDPIHGEMNFTSGRFSIGQAVGCGTDGTVFKDVGIEELLFWDSVVFE